MVTKMPPMDFSELAARMSVGLTGVRACLVLSRDGLSLGTHPADGESEARQAWEALQRIGDPQRGFVDMGTEIWVVASGGAYAAVMVATPEAKPGLLLDRMGAELLAAEENRALAGPDPTPPAVVDLSESHAAVPSAAEPTKTSERAPEEPARPPRASGTVDRVALSREFGRLFEGGQ